MAPRRGAETWILEGDRYRMTDHDIEANKALVNEFFDAFTARDIDRVAATLHDDFVWNTAVQADDAPNELRPMQSNLLRGRNMTHKRPRLNREEAVTAWGNLFKGVVGNLDSDSRRQGSTATDDNYMRIEILGMTAEGERVAVEAQSNGLYNPANKRRYQNFYHGLFKIKDGKIALYKEYQDTLHLFDFISE
jgi:ketosteroid isomerase-like protein